jgi:hypothetical protein
LLHGAQTLMHLLKAIAHQFKRFAEAFFQRALQFFIHSGPHSVDLLRVVLLQLLQAQIDDRSHAFERLR